MTTPRASFIPGEGRLLQVLLVSTTILFLIIMGITWRLAEEANPVLLDLETGKPVAAAPAASPR
jgi:hypothetical protein